MVLQEPEKKPLILIVDDVYKNLQVLGTMLREEYEICVAANGKQALQAIEKILPSLILLDIMMPEMDGMEVCKRLKLNPRTRDIPVIFLSARADTQDIVAGLKIGAVDYVTKPFSRAELQARIKTHLQLKLAREELKLTCQKLQQANEQILQVNKKLLETQKKLELAARTDPLTKLANRRDMIEKIDEERARSSRSGKPFILVLGDVDNFKRFNDRFGHDCGDFLLVSIASTIRSSIRKQDWVARWGGEEFLLLLPETDLEGGKIMAGKIRKKVAENCFIYKELELFITMTFGVSVYCDNTESIDDCIKKADEALYRGKRSKNCVIAEDSGFYRWEDDGFLNQF